MSGKTQLPIFIFLHGFHERVGDTDRDIEIRNVVFVDLAGDEVFHIRMIHTEDRHIGAAAGVMCNHAIRQISMIILNFQVKRKRLPGRFHATHLHKPESFHGWAHVQTLQDAFLSINHSRSVSD